MFALIHRCTKICNIEFLLDMVQDGCPGTTCRAGVTLTFDLELGPTGTNISNCTSTHYGERLCKFILKSIQNCRSYKVWTKI